MSTATTRTDGWTLLWRSPHGDTLRINRRCGQPATRDLFLKSQAEEK